ncbi:MAG: hypothetical protein SFU56_03605 [Capsulimonadales bacterium]|nr:hypothetical protein [Capsulimonadales bacterium]
MSALLRFSASLALFLLLTAFTAGPATADEPTIRLLIDARSPERQRFPIRLEIPVKPGKVALAFPRWLPGTHGGASLLRNVAGLTVRAGQQTVAWERDRYDPFVLRCHAPNRSDRLTVTFEYLPAKSDGEEVAVGIAASENVVILNGASLFLTPEGGRMSRVRIAPTVLLPRGWQYATALPAQQPLDAIGKVEFAPVSAETFVDSPIFAGKYAETVRLDKNDGSEVPHYLCLFVDDPAVRNRVLTPIFRQTMQRLVAESGALFGARHYPEFRFLLAVTTKLPVWGLEHHASSVNSLRPDAFGPRGTLDNREWWNPNLLPHEFVHSWVGKYRRPEGLVQMSYETPPATDLLWVYEGLTEYLGELLMVRSGFRDAEKWKTDFFRQTVDVGQDRGRFWQSLQDASTVYPYLHLNGSGTALRPSNAVYFEGLLLWLEIDTRIRTGTGGKKSLDDFCRLFFGGTNRGIEVRPYRREDIIDALNRVHAANWKTFLESRLNDRGNGILTSGAEAAGWQVTLSDAVPAEHVSAAEVDYRFSLGFRLTAGGVPWAIRPDSVADRAGITPSSRIVGVNGKLFSPSAFREAVRASKGVPPVPPEVLVFEEDAYRLVRLPYTDGERFPVPVRLTDRPDLLPAILAPLTPPPPLTTPLAPPVPSPPPR